MILIAHRGLFEGPNPELENHPDQIKRALDAGFDAEIDVRWIDGGWWLGHDGPTYEVDAEFLMQKGLWLHLKNLDAVLYIMPPLFGKKVEFFWHQEDDISITSNGFLWTYPGKPLTDLSICVQPEWDLRWLDHMDTPPCVGVCSKFVGKIRELRGS